MIRHLYGRVRPRGTGPISTGNDILLSHALAVPVQRQTEAGRASQFDAPRVVCITSRPRGVLLRLNRHFLAQALSFSIRLFLTEERLLSMKTTVY